jgi:hypothetical protein
MLVAPRGALLALLSSAEEAVIAASAGAGMVREFSYQVDDLVKVTLLEAYEPAPVPLT